MLALNANGFLPPGVHDASLDEVKRLFGQFQRSDRRPKLFAKLEALIAQLKKEPFVKFLVVNGSFISSKPEPGDIDIVVAIDAGVLQKAEWSPSEYNAISSRRLRRAYSGFDVLVAPVGGRTLDHYLELFSQIKGNPGAQKGLVRLSL